MNASFEQHFVGIDVSKGTLDLAARGQSGTVQFENTSEGIRRMLEHLKCIEHIAVVLMEATGGLEREAAGQLC